MTEREHARGGRLPSPGGRTVRLGWRPVAAAAMTAVCGIALLVGLGRPASDSARFVVAYEAIPRTPVGADPVTAALIRCHTRRPAGDDVACNLAWEASRRRFFGEGPAGRLPRVPSGRAEAVAQSDRAVPPTIAPGPAESDADGRD